MAPATCESAGRAYRIAACIALGQDLSALRPARGSPPPLAPAGARWLPVWLPTRLGALAGRLLSSSQLHERPT